MNAVYSLVIHCMISYSILQNCKFPINLYISSTLLQLLSSLGSVCTATGTSTSNFPFLQGRWRNEVFQMHRHLYLVCASLGGRSCGWMVEHEGEGTSLLASPDSPQRNNKTIINTWVFLSLLCSESWSHAFASYDVSVLRMGQNHVKHGDYLM